MYPVKTRLILFAIVCLSLLPALPGLSIAPVAPVMAQGPDTNITDGCVESFDPDVDYFPDKAVVEYSEGFTVEYFNNYKVVTVPEPWVGGEPVEYVLVQCGTPAPDDTGDAPVIEVPRTSLIAMSTTYLPFIVDLGLLDQLVAIDVPDFVNTPAVRAKLDAGELASVGSGAEVNVEVALDLEPSLIMTYGSGLPGYDAHPVLIEAGLPVVLNAEFTETTPLGRAEWMKYLALFYNLEADAAAQFDAIATQYADLAALTDGIEDRPTVFVNAPYEGTWYMAGGSGFIAHLLDDAGAAYLWADDDSTSSLFLDFETVFERAADADFWLNVDNFWFSLDDVLAADERFASFAAVENGQVWAYNKAVNAAGGNDFFEGGVANPHLVLADLIAIFHPDLLPDHEFVYYQQLQ